MAKIIVLGNSGAGKSTFTTALGQMKNIEYLHLDPLVFKYNWNEPNFEEMEEKVNDMLTKPEWIIDGNYINNALRRFEECDTVYFLDINRFVCLHSVLKRHRTYKGKYRASRSLYCDEKITKDYLNWVFNQFYKTSRKHILNYLKTHSDKNIVVFKNRRQVNKYLEEVSK